MPYRTILVHADLSRHAQARIRAACALARACDAHLIGGAVTGLSQFLLPGSVEMGGPMIADQVALMADEARRALRQFDDIGAAMGVASREPRLVNDDIDGGMALQARYADLIVVGQTDPDERAFGQRADLPEYLLMNTGRPLLVLPYTGVPLNTGGKALVAWDGSVEATRAVAQALPLLKLAREVVVVVFNPEQRTGAHGAQPGADLALYLSRHGLRVEVSAQASGIDTGNALLSSAADMSADLLVMGGYGHARFRELLLGGVTRTVLRSMTLPVLLSH